LTEANSSALLTVEYRLITELSDTVRL